MLEIVAPIWVLVAITGAGLVAGGIAFWRYRSRATCRQNGILLSKVLNNLTQGVVLIDANERLLVHNERYVAMYGLSPEIVKPGCTLTDLIRNRIDTGSLNLDPEKYRAEILESVGLGEVMSRIVETPDGRAVSVVNRPIEGGASGSALTTISPIESRPSTRAPPWRSRNAVASPSKRRSAPSAKTPPPCWRR